MTSFIDRCIFLPVSVGTGAFVVASAINGFLTPFQAGAVDMAIYRYSAELRDANNVILAWEVGTGTYTAGTTTLTRSPEFSSSGNATVSFASQPQVMLTLLGQDVNQSLSINRADIPVTKINSMVIEVAGNTATGDFGTGVLYSSSGAGPSSLRAIQDAAGTWFGLVPSFSVGYDIDLNLWGASAKIQNVQGPNIWGYSAFQFSADTGAPIAYFTKSRATTFGTHAIVHDGDDLGGVIFGGDDGVTYDNASALIIARVDGVPGAGDVPGRLSFQVAPAGGASGAFALVEVFGINSDKTSDFAGTVNITPPFDGSTNLLGLNVFNNTGGTPTTITTDFAYNKIVAANDTTHASAANFITSAFSVELDTGGSNINNEKTAIRALTQFNVASASYNQDIQAIVGQVAASQSMGGTNTGAGAKGSVYAINPSAVASGGASNLGVVSGGEVDAWILSPATASFRWGWSMVSGGDTQGAQSDAAIQFSSVTSTPWKHILSITAKNGHPGIAAGSTVIGSDGTAMAAVAFADLDTIDFSSFIMNFKFFQVGANGQLVSTTNATSPRDIQTGATYTISNIDSSVVLNHAGTVTLTLPSAAAFPGRWLYLKTVTANTVVSASSDVVPLAGGAAGTAILAATIGKWASLQSTGGAWEIMASN